MSGSPLRLVAVDLGATSGRVMVGLVGADRLELEEVHRFANGAVEVDGSLRWDVRRLYAELLAGLRAAAAGGPVHGIGIDAWAIDHGLLDASDVLLADPYCYRDSRTDGVAERVLDLVGARELYERTGLQQLPFNTIYQLVAAADAGELDRAATMLLLPDLLTSWLTGVRVAERTNASTTGLYDVRHRDWDRELVGRVGLPASILPPLVDPGTVVGPLLPSVTASVGLPEGVPVVAVGSHDTASAVAAAPLCGSAAYISSGTWSLVGLELPEPVLTEEARLADFTNEAGVDGTVRFLKNVTGLWVLSEAMREWDLDLATLLAQAEAAEPLRTVVDVNHPSLLPPGPMTPRLVALAEAAGEPAPRTPGEFARCVLDGLVLAYRRHLRQAATLAGVEVDVVHVVGGGSRNALLQQLTADACGRPVLAGPVEASAMGNVLVQARTLGVGLGSLADLRDLVRRTHELRRFEPRTGVDWAAAEARLTKDEGSR